MLLRTQRIEQVGIGDAQFLSIEFEIAEIDFTGHQVALAGPLGDWQFTIADQQLAIFVDHVKVDAVDLVRPQDGTGRRVQGDDRCAIDELDLPAERGDSYNFV